MSILSWHDIWIVLLGIVVFDGLLVGLIALGHSKCTAKVREWYWGRRKARQQKLARLGRLKSLETSFTISANEASASLQHFQAQMLKLSEAFMGLLLYQRLHRFIRPHYNDCPCTHCLHNSYWRTITGE